MSHTSCLDCHMSWCMPVCGLPKAYKIQAPTPQALGFNPTRGIDVCLYSFCVFIIFCMYRPRDGPISHQRGPTKQSIITKSSIFWDITPCNPLTVNRYSRRNKTCFACSRLTYSWTMKTEATFSSETSTDFNRTTRRFMYQKINSLQPLQRNSRVLCRNTIPEPRQRELMDLSPLSCHAEGRRLFQSIIYSSKHVRWRVHFEATCYTRPHFLLSYHLSQVVIFSSTCCPVTHSSFMELL
jgi:hypothetical protein